MKWRIYNNSIFVREEDTLAGAFQSAREILSRDNLEYLRIVLFINNEEYEVIKVHK